MTHDSEDALIAEMRERVETRPYEFHAAATAAELDAVEAECGTSLPQDVRELFGVISRCSGESLSLDLWSVTFDRPAADLLQVGEWSQFFDGQPLYYDVTASAYCVLDPEGDGTKRVVLAQDHREVLEQVIEHYA